MRPVLDRIITMALKLSGPAVTLPTIAAGIDWLRPIARKLYRAIPAVLLAAIATYGLSRAGALHGLEHRILDAIQSIGRSSPSDIAIVEITDNDWTTMFDATSPLDLKELDSLIDAISRSHPTVIGVDVDTSHHKFRDFKIRQSWPPVVWERDIIQKDMDTREPVEPRDILGGQDPALNVSSGIPALLDDPDDKVTRFYTQCVNTIVGPTRSFVSAIVGAKFAKEKRDGAPNCDRQHEQVDRPRLIDYSLRMDNVFIIPASAVMGFSAEIPELSQKIVLLGGTYGGYDRHFTPIGILPGVMVLANAIQTQIDGGGAVAPARWASFLLELLAGFLLVIAFQFMNFRPITTLVCGLLTTVVISAAFSLVAFHTASRVWTFLPTLLGVFLFEIFEYTRERAIAHAGR
jgi:hypothetical protein